ncbi:cation/H(+) antiporter 15 [Ziziphus jujuba]|uniref:Cation/H(+) antiporter 15 n=1 Tax=Ziziphus jujuba TaxID=326968 RepID=A0ABM3III4_ZIZJJ|nr:cation/H(+) antiporter 15 [Ziziphus jujuba]
MAYSVLCNATMLLPGLDWCQKRKTPNYLVICYNKTLTHDTGLWQVANALDSSLPLFALQLVTILVMNRLLMLLFRPLGLPRISAEILSGVILGPSFIGSSKVGTLYLFPFRSLLTLETIGNLSLIYYMFLVGLEVDIKPAMRAGKKPLSIALVSLLIPIPVGYALHRLMNNEPYDNDDLYGSRPRYGPIFWGIALATTNFPDLARILSDLKLLHSEVGRIALSSAVITDLFSWVLLVVAIATASDGEAFTIVSSIFFVAMCFCAVRPVLAWLISLTSNDIDRLGEYHICFVMALVPFFGFITDSLGSQSILGAFMLGVIMPKGELKNILMEKVEDFVSGLLMPLFFLIIGLRTDPVKFNVPGSITVITYIIILISAFCTKIISTFMASVCLNRMSPRDGLALGFLMNTKGLLALIIISVGRDLKALNSEAFTVMLCAIWVMATVVGPVLARFYKPCRQFGKYKRRTIMSVEEDASELKILTCVHNPRNISSFVNIIEASNPTVETPINVSVVHLVENTGHHAAMLIVHDTCQPDEDVNKEYLPQNHTINSFENLKSRIDGGITVQELTAVSSYSTIHEDICSLAEDKTISLIIVPFHKQTGIAVEAGTDNNANNPFGDVNKNVMDSAQCSVALFVDRGLSTLEYCEGEGDRRHFYMVFIGGDDDREALAYAWRMSNNSTTDLTVIRFVRSEDAIDRSIDNDDHEDGIEDILTDRDKQIDDDYIKEFKTKSRNSMSVEFVEHVVSNGDEMVRMIGSLDYKGDLFIVGRGKKRMSALTKGLLDLGECPELGALGDILVSSSFMAETSILIVQRGASSSSSDHNDDEKAASGGQLKEHIGRMTWDVSEAQAPEFAPFVHRRGRHMNHDSDHL